MAGNSIGELFKVTTFGESHGKALGCIIDGCPPGMALNCADLQPDLNRRRPGSSLYTTPRQELDEVQILSGVFNGLTTGTSIGLIIENCDQRSKDYGDIKDKFRPGHADFTYEKKYGIRDYRGGGRSSARETAMRVAAGAIAKKYLAQEYNIKIQGYLSQIGSILMEQIDLDIVETNPFFAPDIEKLPAIENLMCSLKKEGDSIGAKVKVLASNVPCGLGEPVFARLDAEIAKSLMSINAVKAVEIGDGAAVASQRGSEHRDLLSAQGFLSNHAGGILGGISTGQTISAQIALKPTSSLTIPCATIDKDGNETTIITKGRHDPCVGIRAVPIAEAMLAITLMDHLLRDRAQNNKLR